MELLKEIVPNLRRVAYIVGGPGVAYNKMAEEDRQIAASGLGFKWQVYRSAAASDYDEIFARVAAEHFDAAYIPTTPFNINNSTRICQLALRHRMLAVSDAAAWAKGCAGDCPRPVDRGRTGFFIVEQARAAPTLC